MNAYVYKAALLCETCARTMCLDFDLVAGNDLRKCEHGCIWVACKDSDCAPQGPYPDGGGEADCPQHCAYCGVFLQTPLTADGWEYVRMSLQQSPTAPCASEWREFYL